MKQIPDIQELYDLVGQEIGTSPAIKITQEMINNFAKSTLDEQWIHTQPEKAIIHSPFKTTIAHGYLTLSLAPYLSSLTYKINSVKMAINYGTEKVRFTSPVPVDSAMSMSVHIKAIRPFQNGHRLLTQCVFGIDGSDKPVCIADLVILLYE